MLDLLQTWPAIFVSFYNGPLAPYLAELVSINWFWTFLWFVRYRWCYWLQTKLWYNALPNSGAPTNFRPCRPAESGDRAGGLLQGKPPGESGDRAERFSTIGSPAACQPTLPVLLPGWVVGSSLSLPARLLQWQCREHGDSQPGDVMAAHWRLCKILNRGYFLLA